MSYLVKDVKRSIEIRPANTIRLKELGHNGHVNGTLVTYQPEDSGGEQDTGSAQYLIAVHQDCGDNGFVLYESNDLDETTDAFEKLESTLSLILSSENPVALTAEMLSTVILPEPASDERAMLVKLMTTLDSQPEYFEALHPVIEILQLPSSVTVASQIIRQQSESGGPLMLKMNVDDTFTLFRNTVSTAAVRTACTVRNLVVDDSKIKDEELAEKIWQSFYSQARSMATPLLMTGENLDKKEVSLVEAVRKGYVDTAFQLLLYGCDPNAEAGAALFAAVETERETIVKLLLAFNADPTIENKNGESPIDLAVKASPIYNHLLDAKRFQAKTRKYFSCNSTLPPPRNSCDTYLLSLDGGGVRGFNSAQFVIACEARMKELSPDCKPFCSYFDYIAGTSAGGIAALIALYTDHDVYTARYLVYKLLVDVFDKKKKHRERLINEYFQGIFGTKKVMADLEGWQRIILTTTLADREPNKLHLITNYGSERDQQEGPEKVEVCKAALMTSAAPFYFPAVDDRFLDGGLMANNPTLTAMTEIIEQSDKRVEFGCIVSVGNGRLKEPIPVKYVDVFVPGFSLRAFVEIPNAFKGLLSLFDHFVNQVTQSDGECVQTAKAWCKNNSWQYHRYSPPLYGLSKDIGPASTDREVIIDMLYHTQMDILDHPEVVDDIAKRLLTK